ncbi:EamA family transporter [Pseudaminobacter arsenicus]|uniref:EamA family transporter n=1 Tax=Borborobacter arsenicus TaxID=1851146 RepID=A0A432VAT0_9HYPH|nr:EamA family transporter [Pseudaminobacter arsenicus]RUM99299.1 EamA family transporter [Pseudaminobacter arsenicus]
MEPIVFIAVLLAAAFHAGWNAIVKIDLDRFLSVTLISVSACIIAAPMLPFVAIPHAATWPWLLVSIGLHTGYKLFLIQAYRAGDLGQVYPIARGAAPLIVSFVMSFFFGEMLTPAAMVGIAMLVTGVCLMSLRGGRDRARLEKKAISFALITSVFIAGYTVTDGLGARLNGDAHGYAVWLFVLDGLTMLGIMLALRGWRGLAALQPYWRSGLAGGTMSLGAYWIVIWAATLAPIALVSALRESSVLFAAAISVLILREPLTRWRLLSALVIVTGILATRMS